MKVNIEHLEKLSKLKIKEEEKEKFEKDFEKILDFVDEITKLDLPEDDKTLAISLNNLRNDEIIEKEECDVLKNAPSKKDGCFLTPLVVE